MATLSKEVISEILKKGRIYEVGGAVRDRLLHREDMVKDRDYLVTGIPYRELTRILEPHGTVGLVGRSFGVIKFTQFFGGEPVTFDISLPRTEHSTGSGHKDFAVTYDPNLSIEDDLVRRDFTINAMAWALDNDELVDPLGGQVDLQKKQIRMVYGETFQDDPLRMLRAIQFAARFEFTIEKNTFDAIRENASLITTVSSERIAEELTKLLTRSKKPSHGFRLMESCGLLKEILPELQECVSVQQPGGYHKYDVFEHTLHTIDATPPTLRLRLAALFHDIRKPKAKREVGDGATFYGHEVMGAKVAEQVLNRLRFSKTLIREVATLVDRHMFTTDVSPKGMRRLVRRVGVPLIFDLLDLRRADVVAQGMGGTTEDVDKFEADIRDELERKSPFSLRDLALNGDDIKEMFSLPEGPMVGKILNYLLEQVLDNPSQNTAETLKELAKEYYNSQNATINDSNNKEAD